VKHAKHPSHGDIVKRLNRADGHLRKVVLMIEAGRSCLDVAQQLHAVERAISAAKRVLIHEHLDHCLDQILQNETRTARASLSEFKEIAKYL